MKTSWCSLPCLAVALVPYCFAEDDSSAEKLDLQFKSIQRQEYRIQFVARPADDRFQISRIPSARWPKRITFLMKEGEVSDDGQFRIDAFTEKVVKHPDGNAVDASELTITHLPSGKQHLLVRNIELTIPTWFAELRDGAGNGGKSFFVKEGEKFDRKEYPGHRFRLKKVEMEEATIEVEVEARKVEIVLEKE